LVAPAPLNAVADTVPTGPKDTAAVKDSVAIP
jgi:hypothetical protein